MNAHNSTGYWWSWTFTYLLKNRYVVKFYFQAAGLYVILGNWKLWLLFQKRSEPKERNREKRSLVMKVWWIIFRCWLPLPSWWWWWIVFAEWLTDESRFTPYFQPGPLSEILTIANLRHAASRVWTCAESEFRLYWMKLCSSDNHYIKQEGVNLSHFFP